MYKRIQFLVYATAHTDTYTRVYVDEVNILLAGDDPIKLREAVGHQAWLDMWANETDQWGYPTDTPSATARVLRKLCDSVPGGATQVKQKFVETITFKQVDDDEKSKTLRN